MTEAGDAPKPSLFRDLADGSAGWGVRVLVAIASAILLIGAALIAAYVLAGTFPNLDRSAYFGGGQRYGVRPRDEAFIIAFLSAATLWLITLIWLLTRRAGNRAFVAPSLITLALAAATILIGVLVAYSLPGDSELIIVGTALVAAAVTLLVWVRAVRAMPRHRATLNPVDRRPDVRCPECGYRMVGLHECRCPECGKAYTVDELIARQNFAPPRAVRESAGERLPVV